MTLTDANPRTTPSTDKRDIQSAPTSPPLTSPVANPTSWRQGFARWVRELSIASVESSLHPYHLERVQSQTSPRLDAKEDAPIEPQPVDEAWPLEQLDSITPQRRYRRQDAVPDPQPLALDVLVDIAEGIARAEPLWKAVVRHDATDRQAVRLLATDAYEVWVLGWTTGQRVELHDHGPSAAAISVTEGTLTELSPGAAGLDSITLPEGSTHTVPVGHPHDVANLALAPATSIHVYSPPLREMTRYDPVALVPESLHHVEAEAPALPAAAAEALLGSNGQGSQR